MKVNDKIIVEANECLEWIPSSIKIEGTHLLVNMIKASDSINQNETI
jgi:hypothetical protein